MNRNDAGMLPRYVSAKRTRMVLSVFFSASNDAVRICLYIVTFEKNGTRK